MINDYREKDGKLCKYIAIGVSTSFILAHAEFIK